MQPVRHGFLLGKFLPPHQGHVFMCDFARQYCDDLTILVATLPSEPIPGDLRAKWMQEMFPDCRVVHIDRDLPQEPSGPDDDRFWAIWRATALDAITIAHGGGTPQMNVVFASEHYGNRLATELGARFVPVDIDRTTRAVSGTAIRNDPFANWEYIPPVVRPHYVKRVTLFGPESTGKSTVGRQLADHYRTVMIPEYGRTYTETFGTDCTAEDLLNIARGHIASVSAGKRQANRIVIEDTDPVMTAVWSDMLLGSRDEWFSQFTDYGDLYFLTDVDIPWVDDGTRYFSNDEDRRRFFNRCRDELKARQIPYRVLSGTREQRFATACQAINQTFGLR